jgi:hypothetical protein
MVKEGFRTDNATRTNFSSRDIFWVSKSNAVHHLYVIEEISAGLWRVVVS